MMTRVRDAAVWLAALTAIGVLGYFLVATLGTKVGFVDWRFGFGVMTFQWGATVLIAGAALTALGVLLALVVTPRRGVIAALLAFAVPAAGLAYGYKVRTVDAAVPPIHDISTDLNDIPSFSEAVLAERAATPDVNDVDLPAKRLPDDPGFGAYAGKSFIELQQEFYGLGPILLRLTPEDAFESAERAARGLGWRIVAADAASGRIEAVSETFWYGFKDDIVIRVRPEGEFTRIDVRSTSRVGLSDLGANAARIEAFRARLSAS